MTFAAVNIGEIVKRLWETSGFNRIFDHWENAVMIVIACVLLYLAIARGFEPLLLMGIAFGMLLANLPLSGMMHMELFSGKSLSEISFSQILHEGGILDILYLGVKLNIYPCLIFMGIGAMTDFGPMLARPSSMILGAAAQLGVYCAFFLAILFGFLPNAAAAIGIIGGADGPTAIFLASYLSPEHLGPIAIAAYSYMALIPLIQPPIMKALTTKKERETVMTQAKPVTKTTKIVFPIAVTVFCVLLLPDVAPLIGCFMLGNLFRESGVADRLSDTAQNNLPDKAIGQMAWTAAMNALKAQAEELVLSELIYA